MRRVLWTVQGIIEWTGNIILWAVVIIAALVVAPIIVMRRHVLWTVAIIVALVVALIIVLGYVREWEWTGLVKDKAYTKRTLWDWLQLLIIPAVLAGGGLWFNRQQREQELQTADRRAQDEALQAYLDQMSDMLISNKDQPSLSDEHPPDSLKTVARARTLTVLPRLAADRKARVVQFLYESGLITKDRGIVDLKGANLSEADLSRADLSRADLGEAKLDGANLYGADLRWAKLDGANLYGADLSGTANLYEADLSGANLTETNLHNADLRNANLNGAVLIDAKGWTEEQLTAAESLGGATMPDGYWYEDWLEDKEQRDWLKSQGHWEDGENSGP